MKNIIKDIEDNCPQCYCNTEETIKFMANRGDISWTSDHYREVWFFYLAAMIEFGSHKAYRLTLEVMKITPGKWKCIRRWVKKVGINSEKG